MLGSRISLAVALLAVNPRDGADAWMYFDSRETKSGPKLVLTGADGSKREIGASADATLLSYLPDSSLGAHEQLSLSRGDTNRVLVRFEVNDVGPFERAELVLEAHPSAKPPREAFDVALVRVNQAWQEGSTSWSAAPACASETAVAFSVPPRAARLAVDVTALARTWLADATTNHGLLLRVARAVAQDDPRAIDNVRERLLEGLDLATDVQAALARAKAEHKAVLAIVVGTWTRDALEIHDELLFSTALAHPNLRRLVQARCVPVRIERVPHVYSAASVDDDPLEALGTTTAQVKAPALVISRDGKASVLGSLGSFDPQWIARFVIAALGDSPAPRGVDDPWTLLDGGWLGPAEAALERKSGPDSLVCRSALASLRGQDAEALQLATRALEKPGEHEKAAELRAGIALARLGRLDEALAHLEKSGDEAESEYTLALVRAAKGDGERARATFTRLAPDTAHPYSLLAAAWLAWPERMRMLCTPVAPRLAGAATTPEVTVKGAQAERRAIEFAIEYLALVQLADGSWPLGDPGVEDYRGGVAALAAHALFDWRDELAAPQRALASTALERADRWLTQELASAAPASLNSFAAAYWLDYQLARLARGAATKADVQAATDLLMGGRMENGAWAYSKEFGEGWQGGIGGWPVTDKGRAHSMNTGLALEVLARAKAAGARIDGAKLAASAKTLLAMRVKSGAYTYTWPEPRNFEGEDASIARASVCELALWRLGSASKADLRHTLDRFLEQRAGLRLPVKLTASWLPPHGFSSYFWFFAYEHASEALAALGDSRARTELQALRQDVLSVVEPDGTWVDFEATGKPYGTAMALLLLHRTAR